MSHSLTTPAVSQRGGVVAPGSNALERSILCLQGGYRVNVLRTPTDERDGKERFLYSGGLCTPNDFAKPLHIAFAREHDLAAVDINGFDLGGTPPRSLDELVHVHRLVIDALGWDDEYKAGGHSTGATVARGLCFTDHPPASIVMVQPILANDYTPEDIMRKVEAQCRFWYWFAGVRYPLNTAMREFIRRKIEHQLENWMNLVRNGTADDLLEDITRSATGERFSYATRPTDVPGVAYVSRFDDLFPSTARSTVADLAEGTPNARIIDLQHHAYGHTWPLTDHEEAVRVIAHGGEPLRPTAYTKARAEAQEHPVRTSIIAAGAVGLGYLALQRLRQR